jgi:hypothetical protein
VCCNKNLRKNPFCFENACDIIVLQEDKTMSKITVSDYEKLLKFVTIQSLAGDSGNRRNEGAFSPERL